MNEIRTHDKPSLVAAFTSAMVSDSDTLIRHDRKSGITEFYVKGEIQALLGAVDLEIHERRKWAAKYPNKYPFKPVIETEAVKIRKRVLRDRKRAVAKMKKAVIKMLCG